MMVGVLGFLCWCLCKIGLTAEKVVFPAPTPNEKKNTSSDGFLSFVMDPCHLFVSLF